MICVLSDSHDNFQSVRRAVQQMKEFAPELVLHCGDITTAETLELFRELPMRFVFGNCDVDEAALQKKAKELAFPPIEHSSEVEMAGKRILVNHGVNWRSLDHAVAAQSFDYLFYGHSHQKSDEREGRTRIVNPGALYRASTYTFASIDLERDVLTFHEVLK